MVILASPNTLDHSANVRFVVISTLVCSYQSMPTGEIKDAVEVTLHLVIMFLYVGKCQCEPTKRNYPCCLDEAVA